MKKQIINCVECPKGCEITVETEEDKIVSITGNSCPRGKLYGENEIICPRRVLTTTIKTADGKVVPVKTDKPIKKSEIFDIMKIVNGITLKTRVKIGDIVMKNITEGINLIATDDYE